MSYTYNKPDATDTISSSQAVIKDNFTAIKGLIDIDHITFGDPDQGKHKYVTMPIQTSLPVVGPNEWTMFVASDGTNPQVYLRNNSSGAIDLTKDAMLTGGVKATTGWCMLPCGIIMQWGSGSMAHNTTTAGGSFVKAFNTFYNITASPYTMVTSSYSPQDSVFGISGTTTAWSAERSSSHKDKAISFYWLALGV